MPVRAGDAARNISLDHDNVSFAWEQGRGRYSGPAKRARAVSEEGRGGPGERLRARAAEQLAALRGRSVCGRTVGGRRRLGLRLRLVSRCRSSRTTAPTPAPLDRLNSAAAEAPDGPERILQAERRLVLPRGPDADLDGRYLGWDPPEQSRAVLCDFDPLATSERWQVLGRVPDRCGPAREVGGERRRRAEQVTGAASGARRDASSCGSRVPAFRAEKADHGLLRSMPLPPHRRRRRGQLPADPGTAGDGPAPAGRAAVPNRPFWPMPRSPHDLARRRPRRAHLRFYAMRISPGPAAVSRRAAASTAASPPPRLFPSTGLKTLECRIGRTPAAGSPTGSSARLHLLRPGRAVAARSGWCAASRTSAVAAAAPTGCRCRRRGCASWSTAAPPTATASSRSAARCSRGSAPASRRWDGRRISSARSSTSAAAAVRVARHWAAVPGPEVHGCDYNPELVEWCASNLCSLRGDFRNELAPPLPYVSGSFDLIYALSVFTHLDDALQRAWLDGVPPPPRPRRPARRQRPRRHRRRPPRPRRAPSLRGRRDGRPAPATRRPQPLQRLPPAGLRRGASCSPGSRTVRQFELGSARAAARGRPPTSPAALELAGAWTFSPRPRSAVIARLTASLAPIPA